MPLELVQKVTGHKTTDIVLKHYFQPGREDFRQALHLAMPKLLTVGKDHETTDNGPRTVGQGKGQKSEARGQRSVDLEKALKKEMREMIDQVKPKALRERMLRVLAKWCIRFPPSAGYPITARAFDGSVVR